MGFKVTHLVFFKDLIYSEIIVLLNYIEKNEEEITKNWVNDTKFLYDYYRDSYGEEFESFIVLKFIYLYLPRKNKLLPKLKLSISFKEMEELVEEFDLVYELHSSGKHEVFEALKDLHNCTLLDSRDKVWLEALTMNNFLDTYSIGTLSWKSQRGMCHFKVEGEDYTIAFRRIAFRLIIIEAKGKDGVEVTNNIMNSIQSKVDIVTNLAYKNKKMLERVK